MKNILYITNDGLTDPLGRSQIIPYLQGLSSDCNIHILACEKDNAFLKNRIVIEELLNKSGITWHVVKYRNKPPVLSSWLMQNEIKSLAKEIIKKENINLIHCRSYPAAITGMSLSKKFKIPFVFDMRGFWADERIDRNIWNKRNPVFLFLYKYFKRKEKQLLKQSEHIITLTHKAKDILISDFNTAPSKITVIPCAADLDFFKKQSDEIREQYRQKLELSPENKLMMYMGSTGSCYLTKEMLLFYKYCKTKMPEIRMAFFSPEHSHEYIKNIAENLGLAKDEIICKFISRDELPSYLSAVDYSIMFFENSFSIQGSSPTKHGELLGMQIPVVTNTNVGDLESIIIEKDTGFAVSDFSEKEFEKVLNYLTTTNFKSDDFAAIANKHYSLEKAIEKLKKILSSES
ncbi:MAG: glycosyltransferase [Bacteroidetes bacterium]|nr:glycosyltransferase [Bacteroidota bacterium]